MGKEAYVKELPVLDADPSAASSADWHRLYRKGNQLFSLGSIGAPVVFSPRQLVHVSFATRASTTSLTGVMKGFGLLLTPLYSGKIVIIASGTCTNGSNNRGCVIGARYGTGTSPADGGALTGTLVDSSITTQHGGGHILPFTLARPIAALLPLGTQHWFDLSLAANTAGTSAIANTVLTVMEI